MFRDIFKDDATGQWSLSRISAVVTLAFNCAFALGSVIQTGQLPDLGNNWLILILALYGLNKAASTAKEITNGGN